MTKHRNPAYSEEYRREAVRRSELPCYKAINYYNYLRIAEY
jgi:hypothetical protein